MIPSSDHSRQLGLHEASFSHTTNKAFPRLQARTYCIVRAYGCTYAIHPVDCTAKVHQLSKVLYFRTKAHTHIRLCAEDAVDPATASYKKLRKNRDPTTNGIGSFQRTNKRGTKGLAAVAQKSQHAAAVHQSSALLPKGQGLVSSRRGKSKGPANPACTSTAGDDDDDGAAAVSTGRRCGWSSGDRNAN